MARLYSADTSPKAPPVGFKKRLWGVLAAVFLSRRNLKPDNMPITTDNEIIAALKDACPLVETKIRSDPEGKEQAQQFCADQERHQKFVSEAIARGIKILDSIPESAVIEQNGPVIILQNIGKNARLSVRNGGVIVLGDVEFGAILEVKDRILSAPTGDIGPHRNEPGLPYETGITALGITVAGKTGSHARLNSSSTITINDAGDFIQLRAADTIKASTIGVGANLMARNRIEADDIGDDLRATHYTNIFVARQIGKRSIIKAGSIHCTDVGGGAEFTASYSIETGHIGENCTFVARTILVKSTQPGCQLYAALTAQDISQQSVQA